MYGILAVCIAVMAMFLGLFALSVPPEPTDYAKLSQKTAIEAISVPGKHTVTQ
jgi:hypothetical protein